MVKLPFLKKKEPPKKEFKDKTVEEKFEELKLGGEEEAEEVAHKKIKTGYPAPNKRYKIQLMDPHHNIESMYHHLMLDFGERLGLNKHKKIIDSMGLSVGSSMFGNFQTRLAAQQNQASQYLKGISEMVKGMFQIVREVRIIEERLQFYYDTLAKDPKSLSPEQLAKQKGHYENKKSSEIVLKSLWVDQVEGGSKNPSSVYGLSATVGFTILPDIFFRITPMKTKDIEKEVEKLKFNEKVKEILKRKLRQYYEWKDRTLEELETRRNFVIKYLRQHHATIKLYMSWVSPYLRNIKRLRHTDDHHLSGELDVVTAFESTIIEVETLHWREGYHKKTEKKDELKYNAVVLLNFHYLVKPELAFHHYEYQHRGPIHVGKMILTMRAYSWTNEQIKNYLKYKSEEELDLLREINSSIDEAMNALGEDLKKYLEGKGEDFGSKNDEEKIKKKPLPSIFDPFVSVLGGFGDMFKTFNPAGIMPGGKKVKKEKEVVAKYTDARFGKRASDYAILCLKDGYQKFKENHELLHW
ncbi:MAG: hypothetical protein KKF44_10125 [Nanoarchaeota archaeon]|nr:hypothetical protein [Nanoarchaeota archaeon]